MNRTFPAYTLIELLIVIGVFTILIGIGLPVTIDFVRNYSLQSERNSVITLLEFARNQSLTNVNQSSHGLKINANEYATFSGTSYAARDPQYDLSYPKSNSVSISGPSEIVFAPLSGRSNQSSYIISDGVKQFTVTVNQEGTIDW
jgi:Tfp pilus assembly protein FimT